MFQVGKARNKPEYIEVQLRKTLFHDNACFFTYYMFSFTGKSIFCMVNNGEVNNVNKKKKKKEEEEEEENLYLANQRPKDLMLMSIFWQLTIVLATLVC